MTGFHAVKLCQNETFHCLYPMDIIIYTHFNAGMGKMKPNNTSIEEPTTASCQKNVVLELPN
jgi:hypothetical protein